VIRLWLALRVKMDDRGSPPLASHDTAGDPTYYQNLFQLQDIDFLLRSNPEKLATSAGSNKTTIDRSIPRPK